MQLYVMASRARDYLELLVMNPPADMASNLPPKELYEQSEAVLLILQRLNLIVDLLQRASRLFARLACGLASERAEPRDEPRFEFHAEAGAPEGALYVDSRLVGWLDGVHRL